MKRLLILGIAVFMLCLCACGNNPTAQQKETNPINNESANTQTVPADNTMVSGEIDEIMEFSFTLKSDDGESYLFIFGEDTDIPQGLYNCKNGDKVTVTYQGTLKSGEPFRGIIVSVEACTD